MTEFLPQLPLWFSYLERVYQHEYAAEPEVIPGTNQMIVSIAPDYRQDYGIYLVNRDGSNRQLLVDNAGTTFMQSLRTLRKGGRLLTVGNSGGPRFEIDNRYIFAKHLSILGSTMSTLADFKEVMDLIVDGKLMPILDKTYPLQDAAGAQERLWRNANFGKITLEIPS